MTTEQYFAKCTKHDLFVDEHELSDYVLEKEFPIWKNEDLPQKVVKAEVFARLHVLKGSILFSAYDDDDKIVYKEIFDVNNQQTLLKPNVRHSVKALEEEVECKLQLYNQMPKN